MAWRLLLVFLPKEFIETSNEVSYINTLESKEDLEILFICIDFIFNDSNSPFTHVTADNNMLNFFDHSLKKKGPSCILLVQGTIAYIGPAFGNPEFATLPKFENFWKFALPKWKSPLIGQTVDLAKLFGVYRLEYLGWSKGLNPIPQVLIVHTWGVWCKASQKNWNAYESLCLKLPKAKHMILHLDTRHGPFSTDAILKSLPYMHPSFLLAKDVDGHFYRFFRQCEYLMTPATFIFVNSKLAYVGPQHITCDINYFPDLIETALENPLFAK
jgi:hypothetical protein